jgi:hypothetical protein
MVPLKENTRHTYSKVYCTEKAIELGSRPGQVFLCSGPIIGRFERKKEALCVPQCLPATPQSNREPRMPAPDNLLGAGCLVARLSDATPGLDPSTDPRWPIPWRPLLHYDYSKVTSPHHDIGDWWIELPNYNCNTTTRRTRVEIIPTSRASLFISEQN